MQSRRTRLMRRRRPAKWCPTTNVRQPTGRLDRLVQVKKPIFSKISTRKQETAQLVKTCWNSPQSSRVQSAELTSLLYCISRVENVSAIAVFKKMWAPKTRSLPAEPATIYFSVRRFYIRQASKCTVDYYGIR
jgi:hypothetical protein